MSAQQSTSSKSQRTNFFIRDQHASNISKMFQNFYKNQMLVDITLTTKTDNFKVQAHRIILSASSDYFREMLSSTLDEDEVIELEMDGTTLKLVIDFIYSGTIELRCDNIERVLVAADAMNLSTLKVACCDFIRESSNPGGG